MIRRGNFYTAIGICGGKSIRYSANSDGEEFGNYAPRSPKADMLRYFYHFNAAPGFAEGRKLVGSPSKEDLACYFFEILTP